MFQETEAEAMDLRLKGNAAFKQASCRCGCFHFGPASLWGV